MTALADLIAPGRELLDDPAADPAMVRTSLGNVARANRWFGGIAAARHGVASLLRGGAARDVTLLDVGTGTGDLPRALGRWFAARGVAIQALGLERNPTAARLAAESGLATVLADGLALPFPDRSVDLVLLSQIAHHLTAAGILELAREASRVARIGVVIADLVRSRLAQVGFRFAARVLGFDPATRADGVTSIRRGFTPAELEALLWRGGIRARCDRRPGWRVVATWRVT